jgi:hypothetical protein
MVSVSCFVPGLCQTCPISHVMHRTATAGYIDFCHALLYCHDARIFVFVVVDPRCYSNCAEVLREQHRVQSCMSSQHSRRFFAAGAVYSLWGGTKPCGAPAVTGDLRPGAVNLCPAQQAPQQRVGGGPRGGHQGTADVLGAANGVARRDSVGSLRVCHSSRAAQGGFPYGTEVELRHWQPPAATYNSLIPHAGQPGLLCLLQVKGRVSLGFARFVVVRSLWLESRV